MSNTNNVNPLASLIRDSAARHQVGQWIASGYYGKNGVFYPTVCLASLDPRYHSIGAKTASAILEDSENAIAAFMLADSPEVREAVKIRMEAAAKKKAEKAIPDKMDAVAMVASAGEIARKGGPLAALARRE